ncbi:hypothetical protein [Pelagibacterium lentulum]|uniref:YMGG-like Gly-zipper domain-containing protein n=1 Tax=Pelagibacterium lentulum TaxID=2029865 RepID=A0A916RKG0_9HYPH|nr:hypothetical protein [Pelagibacterium lentulum]GGA60659.1 hypothetical protein GCM10011499_33650 [Pelagibacterium lentulum]
MIKLPAKLVLVVCALALAGCSTTERRISGAAIGGATGAIVGHSVAGGLGGAVGAAGGAVVGTVIADSI